jgi:hypothetical protein
VSSAADEIRRVLDTLTPEERTRIQPRLTRVVTHRNAIRRFPTPGHLGQLYRPGWLQTPMLDAIDEAIMAADRGEQLRWVINTPPQEGKTSRLQDGGAYLLLRRPWLRIAYASYEQGVAAQSGLAIRQMLETHGTGYQGAVSDPDREDVLGLMLDPSRGMQTNWSLADVPGRKGMRPGGVLSVGIGSAFTGRPADVLIVDDPLKDAKAADSPVIRKSVIDWFQSVASTRLSANAIVIIIQTRWHEEDLSGWILAEDSTATNPRYRHLNIPAQAEATDERGGCTCRTCAGQPDVLGRAPGEYLLSARGRSIADWEQTKVDVGSRWWFALYQGRPAPPEGGIFQRAWFDRNRVADAPDLVYVMTMVDPADNTGDGDEAGIITGGLDADGQIYVLADDSGHYTVARWTRVAILAALRHGSHQIGYERSLSGLKRAVAAEWKSMRRQAISLIEHAPVTLWAPLGTPEEPWPESPDMAVLDATVAALAHPEDNEMDLKIIWKDLAELWPYVPAIMTMSNLGPPIRAIKAEGTKAFRASMVSPTYEQDRVHHVGHLTKLEHQMATWLESQDSPDRMDAAVHLVTELGKKGTGSRIGSATGNRLPSRQPRIPQILRSTRR